KPIATVKVNMLPYAATLALNDSRLLVTNQDDGSVSVIDTATLKEIGLITVGDKPEGISTHPDDRHVYVANWFDSTVSVIDARTMKVVDTIKTGEGSRAFGQFIGK
ncbi:MAG: YncE family protein, partial [Methylobacter sp.]